MTDRDKEETIAHDDINEAFRTGAIFNASNADSERYIGALGSINILNDPVRFKAIVRALAINHIQMARTLRGIEKTMIALNTANAESQRKMNYLTWAAIALAVIQAIAAILPLFSKNPVP